MISFFPTILLTSFFSLILSPLPVFWIQMLRWMLLDFKRERERERER